MMKSEMQQIREAALACYDSFTDEQKDKAFAIFEAMDSDGSGGVTQQEYEEFFGSSNRTTFHELDTEGTGQLGFEEFKTLFYILITSKGEKKIPVPLVISKDQPEPESSQTSQFNRTDSKYVRYRKAVIKAVTDFNTVWAVGTAVGSVAVATGLCTIM